MTPQRLRIFATTAGGRRVILSCPCIRLSRDLAGWEPVAPALEAMRSEHRRLAPACPHAFPATDLMPRGDRPTRLELARP